MLKILLICATFNIFTLCAFNKVVIWGHKLHSHTHSYVHNAFYRAFKHMGYETYWFDNADALDHFDFSNSLFLTEGQVCEQMPARNDCCYILHNCDDQTSERLIESGRGINLQVYTDDILGRSLEKIAPCIFTSHETRTLYMPWATDLLPHEIEANKARVNLGKKRKRIYWVGTVGDGRFGNRSELAPFIDAAKRKGVKFIHCEKVSVEENQRLIRESVMAPTIVGSWQKKKGYIPCRIFKNISYGQFGMTNSQRIHELFESRILYHPDGGQLFSMAYNKLPSITRAQVEELMDFVKNRHTYINRIEVMLEFLKRVTGEEKE